MGIGQIATLTGGVDKKGSLKVGIAFSDERFAVGSSSFEVKAHALTLPGDGSERADIVGNFKEVDHVNIKKVGDLSEIVHRNVDLACLKLTEKTDTQTRVRRHLIERNLERLPPLADSFSQSDTFFPMFGIRASHFLNILKIFFYVNKKFGAYTGFRQAGNKL